MNKDQSAVRALPRAGALAATPQRLSRLCPEHDPLTLPAPRGQNHLRVNIAALGDVGASLLLGLRLLGGALIDRIHAAREDCDAIIMNAGAYTHYSYAIRDAIAAVRLPCVEVHMSNVHAREEFRHKSVIGPVCAGVIAGFGRQSYLLAVDAVKSIIG